MLAAFESRKSIVPFRHILRVSLYDQTEVICESNNKTFKLDLGTKEIRDQQLANFKKWLTIHSNSI